MLIQNFKNKYQTSPFGCFNMWDAIGLHMRSIRSSPMIELKKYIHIGEDQPL